MYQFFRFWSYRNKACIACPLGFFAYKDSCFRATLIQEFYSSAKSTCKSLGAEVIKFKNYAKYIDFKNVYAWRVLNNNESFWVGAETVTPQVFYWYDDNSNVASWLWPIHQPDNSGGNDVCAFSSGTSFLLEDVKCDYNLRAICEYSD